MYDESNNHLYEQIEHWLENAVGNICKEWKVCNERNIPISLVFSYAIDSKFSSILFKGIDQKVFLKYQSNHHFLDSVKNIILKEKKNGEIKYDSAIKSLSDFNKTEKSYSDLFLYLTLVLSVQDLWKSTDHIQSTLVKFYKGKLEIKNAINVQTGGKNYPLKYILGCCLRKFMRERFDKENPSFSDYLDSLEKEPEVKKIL